MCNGCVHGCTHRCAHGCTANTQEQPGHEGFLKLSHRNPFAVHDTCLWGRWPQPQRLVPSASSPLTASRGLHSCGGSESHQDARASQGETRDCGVFKDSPTGKRRGFDVLSPPVHFKRLPLA